MVDADPNDHELTRWLERGDSLADVVSLCRDDDERMRALDRYLRQRSVVDPEELIDRVEAVVRGAMQKSASTQIFSTKQALLAVSS